MQVASGRSISTRAAMESRVGQKKRKRGASKATDMPREAAHVTVNQMLIVWLSLLLFAHPGLMVTGLPIRSHLWLE